MWKRRSFLASILGAIAIKKGAPAEVKTPEVPFVAPPRPPIEPVPGFYAPISSVLSMTVEHLGSVNHNWGLSYTAEHTLPGGADQQRRQREEWRNNYAFRHINYPYMSAEIVGKTIAAALMIPGDSGQSPDELYWPESSIGIRLIFTDGTAVDLQPSNDDSRVNMQEFKPQEQPAEKIEPAGAPS